MLGVLTVSPVEGFARQGLVKASPFKIAAFDYLTSYWVYLTASVFCYKRSNTMQNLQR